MKLLSKQLKFLEYLLQGKTQTESVILAYGNQNRRSAAVQGARLMKNPKIQSAIRYSVLGAGVFTEELVNTIKSGLEAKLRVRNVNGMLEQTVFPDHVVRLKTLRLFMKINTGNRF